ncbi:uncharacterized protein BXZ73DRAFT_49550 [Epithele typhae]|uniref:uncharacterized protein n=1 Tax=Epithele typhae TaxID=378194 RepID=UPI0020072CAE|nr:uncharacterized protein BXZ73DRAFT_49550 [Epithele typhae]KAH9926331.1 hypothetical protein BXZ73DRAFT_49550 [Epithele typhae]
MTFSATPSPSSSPSLAPVDSSPPSSPSLTALQTPPTSPGARDPFAGSNKSVKHPRIYERSTFPKASGSWDTLDGTRPDATPKPTRPTRVVDPFSGSAKREWRPPTYERRHREGDDTPHAKAGPLSSPPFVSQSTHHYASPTPAARTLGAGLDSSDFELSEDEGDDEDIKRSTKAAPPAKSEEEMWEEAIAEAIEKLHGVIYLSGSSVLGPQVSHIPASIEELAIRTILPLATGSSSAPPSPPRSPPPRLAHLPVPSPFATGRRFGRASTVAAAAFEPTFFKSKDGERLRCTPAARAASLQSVIQQPAGSLRKCELHLFLAHNTISLLPPELFRVTSLTVLSLRSNCLTSIPPQIACLVALQDLNLAQNKLHWLPGEMLTMHLKTLVISGNPWIEPPPPPSGHPVGWKPTTPTASLFGFPSLTELCLRALVAHPKPSPPVVTTDAASQAPALTFLESSYDLPLTTDLIINPSILSVLRVCVPAAVARPAEHLTRTKRRREDSHSSISDDVFGTLSASSSARLEDTPSCSEDTTGSGVCPSPRHRDGDLWLDGREPVFVHPSEERFTWEDMVAGVSVGGEGVVGAGVPLRWRGCSRGCLAFLDPPEPSPPVTTQVPEQAADADAIDDEDVLDLVLSGDDVEMEDLRYTGSFADLGDFEDENAF